MKKILTIEPGVAAGSLASAATTDYSKSCPDSGGSPATNGYNSKSLIGVVYLDKNGPGILYYSSFYSTNGTGFVFLNHDWTTAGHTVGMTIRDPYGNSVFYYEGGWGYGTTNPPIQMAQFYMSVPGTYSIEIWPNSWTVLWPHYSLWLWFNGSIINSG